jgi:hypothetical protein
MVRVWLHSFHCYKLCNSLLRNCTNFQLDSPVTLCLHAPPYLQTAEGHLQVISCPHKLTFSIFTASRIQLSGPVSRIPQIPLLKDLCVRARACACVH